MMSDRTALNEALEAYERFGKQSSRIPHASYHRIAEAARRFLALMPDEDGNLDKRLMNEAAEVLSGAFDIGIVTARLYVVTVLRAITGSTDG